MTKWVILLLISFSFISIPFANATSGRTNSSGCHKSKKVGYHCHGSSGKSSYKSKSKNTANYSSPNKKANKVDSLVQRIQINLDALGYKVGKPDGILGKKTISAIKKFQTKNHLFIDGKPTTGLLEKLVSDNL